MTIRRLVSLLTLFIATITIIYDALPADAASKTVILATTTSIQDSGLLDVLIPLFEKESGFQVKTISVGSGQAMKMGERGEGDVLLVHSPDVEKKFMADGFGSNRRLVMHNDFIIVGHPADSARIRGVSATEAFKRIAQSGATFVSRGDNSGTHAKEKSLWKSAAINPEEQRWYQQTGLGMGQTLNVAAEKKSYTITDRATYLSLQKRLGLEIYVEGDSKLLNIYHVIELNSARWPKVNAPGGKAFAAFMLTKKTQELIGKFAVDKFGAPLFSPDAGRSPGELGL